MSAIYRAGIVLVVLGVFASARPHVGTAQQPASLRATDFGGGGDAVAATYTFLDRQLQHERVRGAYHRKAERVAALLSARGVGDLAEVFFRVLKHERELEVWARSHSEVSYRLLARYPVCEVSGRLGPKRRQGDFQIPEGFYTIDLLNPWSQYHLSMRVSYPNAVDRARGNRSQLGGDIYIHGGCATIGCVPVTDEWIEELYLIAVRARDAGQTSIPVHIYPTRLDEAGLRWLAENYGTDHVDYPFWENLAEGYRAFERTRLLPVIGAEGPRYTVVGAPKLRFLPYAFAGD